MLLYEKCLKKSSIYFLLFKTNIFFSIKILHCKMKSSCSYKIVSTNYVLYKSRWYFFFLKKMISYLKNESCVNRQNVFPLFCFVIKYFERFSKCKKKKMSLFLFEVIEVLLRCFLCKESEHYSLIFSNHFFEVKSKRKVINFFSATLQKKFCF